MDFQTKFLRNQAGDIYAIRQPVNDNKELVLIEIVATGTTPGDAQDLVRQLNFRKELYEANKKHTAKLGARLLKAYRTNTKLRAQIRKLKNAQR